MNVCISLCFLARHQCLETSWLPFIGYLFLTRTHDQQPLKIRSTLPPSATLEQLTTLNTCLFGWFFFWMANGCPPKNTDGRMLCPCWSGISRVGLWWVSIVNLLSSLELPRKRVSLRDFLKQVVLWECLCGNVLNTLDLDCILIISCLTECENLCNLTWMQYK